MSSRKTKEVCLSPRERERAIQKHQAVLEALGDLERETVEIKILADALEEKKAMVKRNNANRRRGKALEKKLAKELGAERVPYSGSNAVFGWGDIKTPHLLGESKSITPRNPAQKNVIILKKDIDDVVRNARKEGKIPYYACQLFGESQVYAVMTLEDWRMLMMALHLLAGDVDLKLTQDKIYVNGVKYPDCLKVTGNGDQ